VCSADDLDHISKDRQSVKSNKSHQAKIVVFRRLARFLSIDIKLMHAKVSEKRVSIVSGSIIPFGL
jgi:hypothetical protein